MGQVEKTLASGMFEVRVQVPDKFQKFLFEFLVPQVYPFGVRVNDAAAFEWI